MRIKRMRAVLVVICMALVLSAGAWQASTDIPGLFSSDIFSNIGTQHSEPKSINTGFFTSMLSTIPEGTVVPVAKQGMSLQLPASSSSGADWMSSALSTKVSPDMSVNPALNSYNQIISRFPNQSSIFGPYHFASP